MVSPEGSTMTFAPTFPSQLSIAASAGIVFALGSIHLYCTFFGNAFSPRDAELEARMKAVSPFLTREISMWKAWVGFNASHSLGAMLFGAGYGYLAIAQPAALFGSPFLLALGFAFLVAMLALARVYWFRIPFRGILCATVLYAVALGLRWA